MRDILSTRGLSRLRRLARLPVLLAFDFDGTLAPIVAHPPDAQIRPRTGALLKALLPRYPVAVISGRGAGDVQRRLRNVDVPRIVGNHGIEPSDYMEQAAASVAAWAPALTRLVAAQPGVDVENKAYSLSIHYRQSPSPTQARAAIHDAVSRFAGSVRIVDGLLVVNVLPIDAPGKGEALLSTMAQFRADVALFVGDDATDEAAFASLDPGASVAVRVGRFPTSAAQWFLRSQQDVDVLLETMLEFRAADAIRVS